MANLIQDKISIVIPVFNAQLSLKVLYSELVESLKELDYELIFVDDASFDNSWKILCALKQEQPERTKIIRLAKNYGQHNATLCGISHSNGELIITMDDDLEHSASDIRLLLENYSNEKADLIYGIAKKKNQPVFRKFFLSCYRYIAKITAKGGKGSSFRLMTRKLAMNLTEHKSPFVFIDEFCTWHTDSIRFVDVSHGQSVKRKSNYSIFNLINLTKNVVIISSTWPLRMVTIMGTLLMSVNFIVGCYFLFRKLFFSIAVEGYTSLIVSILFSAGLLLLGIGVIAEYLSKIIINQYNKPVFQEKEIL